MIACTSAKCLATLTPMRSACWALRFRFMSGNNFFAASSDTTSATEFASMWGKAILFCMIACRPTSSKCDLTLMTSVLPLAPVDQLEEDRPQVSFGHCCSSPLCVIPYVPFILRINRNLNLFVDSAEDLDGSPKLGSWDRLSSWHLAPQ